MIRRIVLAFVGCMMMAATCMAAAIGEWKAYMAYHDIQDLEQAGNVIYVLASDNLYAYNTNDQSVQTYSKADFLNDCGIDLIEYNGTAGRLVIVYADYNIDLLSDNGDTELITDYNNSTLTVDKTVYDIYMNGAYAYLSTGFGIIKLNVRDAEISDTYNLGFRVDYTYIEREYIYAASSTNGLYRACLTDNLVDKNQWSRIGGYSKKETEDKGELEAAVANANPGGPYHNYFGFLYFHQGKLYSCGRGYDVISDLFRPGCVQVLDGDGDWLVFEEEGISSSTGVNYVNISSVDVDPNDDSHVFAGGRTGLYEFMDGQFTNYYDYSNSLIGSAYTENRNYQVVQSVKYDGEGNLWLLNSMALNESLLELTSGGEWVSHCKEELLDNGGRGLANLKNLFFDSRDLLWFANDNWEQPSLFYYVISSDELQCYTSFVNQDESSLDLTRIYCIAEDLEGNIWIGTDVGPLRLDVTEIYSGENVFQQIKIPRDDGTNLADYLLNGINVTCIVIDGGGRKWFGTNGNGVYLIDSDNITELEHFTASDSPLLSDNIEAIAIDSTSGMVFFGTDKGLCSYTSGITEPVEKMDKNTTYAYPNPVKPDYTGPITITGLTYDADVKIVASSGRLVAKGRSTGGTFIWDGCDEKGKRVAAGIYMVLTATKDGKKGTVCKIAVVR